MKKLHFRISSALKNVIGRDLITNDFVAIFELVKNSFDAGARKINIVFDLDSPIEPTIYVIDNGKGMSYDDIEKKWLFVAYSSKKEGTEDTVAKIYAGNKGVGRFSCDRLGGKLELQSRSSKSEQINKLEVNWGDFEKNSNDFFSSINISYSETDAFDAPDDFIPKKNGVVLKISNLRDEVSWDRKKLLKLRMNLAKLVNPFGEGKSKVEIRIHCTKELNADRLEIERVKDTDETASLVNGVIENPILETLRTKTTWIECRIETSGFLYTDLWDRGENVYKIREKLKPDFAPLKHSDFKVTVFFLNRAAKHTFTLKMGMFARDFGALFLFRNGFRVFPVGEEGDDYWELDRRRAQGHSRYLGNREIIGKVDVHGNENDFKESSSRDKGLIETPASLALKECITVCIRKLERYVVGVTWTDALDKDYDTLERMLLDGNRAKIIEVIGDLANSKDIELIDYNKNLVGILNEKSAEFEPSLINLRQMAESLGDASLIKKIESAEKVLKKAKQEAAEALELAQKEQEARRNAEKATARAQREIEIVEGALTEEKKRNKFLTSSTSRDKEQLENFIHQMIYFAGNNKRLIINQLKATAEKKGHDWESARDTFFQLKEGIDKIISTSRYLTSANFRLTWRSLTPSAQAEREWFSFS